MLPWPADLAEPLEQVGRRVRRTRAGPVGNQEQRAGVRGQCDPQRFVAAPHVGCVVSIALLPVHDRMSTVPSLLNVSIQATIPGVSR